MELAVTPGLGPGTAGCVGSSPTGVTDKCYRLNYVSWATRVKLRARSAVVDWVIYSGGIAAIGTGYAKTVVTTTRVTKEIKDARLLGFHRIGCISISVENPHTDRLSNWLARLTVNQVPSGLGGSSPSRSTFYLIMQHGENLLLDKAEDIWVRSR